MMKSLGGAFFRPLLLLFFSLSDLKGTGFTEAVQYYERGEFQKAAEYLAAASRSASEDAPLHLWLGKSYMKLHRWDDAVRELERAVQIEPANSDYHLWLGRAYGEKASRASFFTAPGWAKKLRREFEAAVKLAPDNLDARFDLLEFYLQAPGIIGGGKDKAEVEVREISRINPRQGHTASAHLYADHKKWELAREELEKSVREFPQEPEPYVDLAEFLLRRREYPAAESTARMALQINKNLPAAKLLLSAAQIQQRKDLSQAESNLREVASGPLRDGEPSFADVFYWLGEAYLAQAKQAEARQALETALRFDPEHSRAKTVLNRLK